MRDYTVYINDRYNMSKEEFECNMLHLKGHIVSYEENHSPNYIPNINYDDLQVGDILYKNYLINTNFVEIEITHLYGGIIFYKYKEGLFEGKEFFLPKDTFTFRRQIYPKIVMKPSILTIVCDCDKTQFKDW